METAIDAIAVGLLLTAGLVVGLASAFFYIVLELPVRLYDSLGAGTDGCVRAGGWALLAGTTAATFFSSMGLSFGLTPGLLAHAVYALTLLAGGIFTGMIAAGLSEILDVLPHTMVTFHLENQERPLMVAVLIGKTLGALIAVLLKI